MVLFYVDLDSIVLNNFMLTFLVNYMLYDIDYYSDLNPNNSKHILDALHNHLKNLNLKDIFSSGGGGGPDPDFLPYKYLLIDIDEKSHIKYKINIHKDKNLLYSSQTKAISKEVDEHNKSLFIPKKWEMIEEQNQMISNNRFLDYYFHDPYGLAFFNRGHDLSEFLLFFKQHILQEVEQYNNYSLCKFYYESK